MSITIAWSTAGNLAPWIEGDPISIQLVAGSNLTGSTVPLVFNIISGSLPTGMTMSSTGLLSGTPLGNQSYKFVVRASVTQAGVTTIADRTFYLNVVGHAPIVNSTVTLPDQYDTVEYSYQVVAVDIDIQDQLTYRIVSGSLPRSLTMSRSGLISGIITRQLPRRFEFTVAVNDGTYTETQNYILNVTDRPPGIDVAPLILNRAGNIGTFRVEDQFSYKIDGTLDGIKEATGLTYSLTSGTLPPGLSLRSNTGWIDGFLAKSNFPPLGQTTYTFSVRVSKGSTVGATKTFSITIDSDDILNELLAWNVPSELGSLRLGSISRFDINPHVAGSPRQFRIKAGTTGILPPNLLLQPNGLITGRVSFFGTDSTPSNLVGVYTFTAEMIDYRGAIIGTKAFTIRTLYQAPYEKIYLQAFPRQPQRTQLNEFLNDARIIPKSYVYRLEDANFGIVSDFKLLVLTGLRPTNAEYYVAAMVKNHLRKAAYIREFRLAVARDLVTTLPIYEVIYGILEDNKQLAYETVTLQRSSKHSLKINNTKINASYGGIISADQQSVVKVFPNSFDNMRSAMGRSLAFAATDVLPEWATSLQDDGVTVGYSNVLPLVYVQVGRGEEILANMVDSHELFNLIPFDIDGYAWEDFVQPNTVGVNEIATSGLTTKYLAFPRTGISKYSG